MITLLWTLLSRNLFQNWNLTMIKLQLHIENTNFLKMYCFPKRIWWFTYRCTLLKKVSSFVNFFSFLYKLFNGVFKKQHFTLFCISKDSSRKTSLSNICTIVEKRQFWSTILRFFLFQKKKKIAIVQKCASGKIGIIVANGYSWNVI